MVIKDEIIQLITKLVTPPAEKWENDPFEVLLKQCPKEVFDKYVDSQPEEAIPSTSDDIRTVNADARIQYSQILGGLYLELAEILESQRSTTDDEFKLVSVQDISVIKSSFQFFLLTGIIPFLEPGVCLPASSRSTFIKSWKLYDGDKQKCAERLDFAAKVIVALLKSNEHIATLFLPKFIDDVIGVHYQLNELKANNYESQLEEVISKCRNDVLFESLMLLSRGGKSHNPPMWLKGACGKVLSKILVSEGGLALMLHYYNARAGDNWTDHLPMTKNVAWCLAAVPKIFNHPLKYHENISKQFFEIIWSQKTPEKNTLNLFKSYVDEVHVRFSHNANVTIFDKILNFWEILDRRIKDTTTHTNMEKIEEFSTNDIRNLQLLSQMQNAYDRTRIRNILTCLFACSTHIPYVKDILRGTLDGVGNLGYTLYLYVTTPSRHILLEKKSRTSSKIQEVGESNGNNAPTDELWLRPSSNEDDGIVTRLADAFFITEEVIGTARLRTLMEMINVALEEFLKVSEKEREDDAARFVQLESAKLFSTTYSHMIVGCCYEKIEEYGSAKGFTPEECIQLLKITENILNNAALKLMRLQHRKEQVEVFRMSASEETEFKSTRETARLCLPVVSMVFFCTQNGGRVREVVNKAVDAMANYIKASDKFPSTDLSYNQCMQESKDFLRKLQIDLKDVTPPVVPQKNERRRYSQLDICNEWIDDLHEEEPAIKGGVLMMISKAFRNKTWHCQKLIDYGIHETVKELIIDEDSYVFLAAINCLCEMALFDRYHFESIIEYYEELMAANNKDDRLIIRIGRIAEAIGRLVLIRGESSITYFDRFATIFMAGIKEPNEILRASSCGAFGNLLMATHGRGVEKWLEQLFHTLTNIIRVDRSPQVRRSAADLIRYSLRAAGKDILVILREQLLDLHREVRQLWTTDRDDTVRLHAQLCCQEIDAALRQNQEDVERGYHRRIRF